MFPTEYKTKDVYLASTLITLGFNHYRIERNGRQCFFIFTDSSTHPDGLGLIDYIEVKVDEYWSGNLKLDPKELFNSFKELKNRMFNGGNYD